MLKNLLKSFLGLEYVRFQILIRNDLQDMIRIRTKSSRIHNTNNIHIKTE